jgi:predicted enzyme related to lactoylglutathione lyase
MSAVVVRPVRFTDHLEPMRAFLETIGLRVRIESQRGGWYDLVAGAGMVGLHSAADSTLGHAQGETCLSFEADDCEIVAEQLRSAGVPDVVVFDEAYGQVLTCTDPKGDTISVDGRSRDLYGYTLHQARPDERLSVQPVVFTDPQGPYRSFVGQFGFTPIASSDEYFATCAADGDAGLIGLHYVYDGELPIVPGPGAVHLTFTTTEPINEVGERLTSAGFEPTITVEDFGSILSVIDPDGLEVQVHELRPT